MAHVLLIEPDKILAKIYMTGLEQAGHMTSSTGQAQLAVDHIDKKAPDVIVLEVQLPAHNGIEFVYELRSYPEWSDIPVILHTFVPPHTLHPQRHLFDQLKIVDYLYKPAVSLQNLIKSIDNVLQRNLHFDKVQGSDEKRSETYSDVR